MSSEDIFPSVPAHWKKVTLGQLAKSSGGGIQTGPFGSQLHAHDYVTDGIPSIMPKNITVDAILTDDIARVSAEDIERLSKYKVQVGDVIYSRRGDVEKCARITSKEDGWLCGTGCLRVRVLPGQVSTEYLHAYLCHPQVREWIVRHAVGATMPNLNTSILNALPIVIPSKPEMEFISFVWLSVSEKIQLNQQINQTLEQMAQAIFKSWFVDFEPVKAKTAALEAGGSEDDALLAAMQAIAGSALFATDAADADAQTQLARLQAEHPEQYATLRATAELFPSAMQESELGEIPEGWEAAQIGDHLDVLETGARPKGGVRGITDGVPSVGAENIIGVGKYQYGKEKFIPTEFFGKLKRGIVEHLDFLLYKDGGKPGDFKPRVSMFGCGFPYEKFAINEHVFRLRSERLGQPFLYFQVGHERVLADLSNKGAKAAIPGINQTDVKSTWIICPPINVLECFNETSEKLIVSILTRSKENLHLSNMRDTLLPKLLSGELSISAAIDQITQAEEAIDV